VKVVFCLSGQAFDFYCTMTRVAISTVRVSNPISYIYLVCDHKTYESLSALSDPLLLEVNEVKVIDIQGGDSVYKSRFLKTSLGNVIDGPFLFLDSDIVVRREFNFEFLPEIDLAACRNHSRVEINEQISKSDFDALTNLGGSLGQLDYVNSGVLFFSGTDLSKEISSEWHKVWLENYKKTGFVADQPSLYFVLSSGKFKIQILPETYNAQIYTRFWFFSDYSVLDCHGSPIDYNSIIWHYNASLYTKVWYTTFESLVMKLLVTRVFNKSDINRLVSDNFPWIRRDYLDDLVYWRMRKTPIITELYRSWIIGKRLYCIRLWCSRKIKSLLSY
jgi:hypothetical protein